MAAVVADKVMEVIERAASSAATIVEGNAVTEKAKVTIGELN